MTAFPATILLFVTVLVVRGATLSRQTIAGRYLETLQDDIAAQLLTLEQQSTASSPTVQAVSAATDEELVREQRQLQVPLRRILQLGNFNERVAFIVASQLERQGRVGMAARMMRQIAPLGGDGYSPAYAWLTAYELRAWHGTRAEAETLISDFDAAAKGGAGLSPSQLSMYATLLVRFERHRDALNLLRDNANKFPQLNLLATQLAKKIGDSSVYREAVEELRTHIEAKRKAANLSLDDLLLAVQLELLEGQIDEAVAIAEASWKSTPASADLRRLYSNLLIAKYQSLAPFQDTAAPTNLPTQEDSSAKVEKSNAALPDLRFLELASQVDPANPLVFDEVAKASAFGQELTDELKQALERSIIEGTASGVTHLILANNKLVGPDPKTALPQLRLSLRQLPNSPIVLNNLAYAIMKYEPDNLAEAKTLIEQGLKTPGVSPAALASMLDTLGEIYFTEEDTLGAIKSYEDALKHDKTKINTRKKLVEAYRKAGMNDLAKAQQAYLDETTTK